MGTWRDLKTTSSFQRAWASVLSTSRSGLTLYYNCPASDAQSRGKRPLSCCGGAGELPRRSGSALTPISLPALLFRCCVFPTDAGEGWWAHDQGRREEGATRSQLPNFFFFSCKTNPIHNRKEMGRRRWNEPKWLLAAHVSSLSTNHEI